MVDAVQPVGDVDGNDLIGCFAQSAVCLLERTKGRWCCHGHDIGIFQPPIKLFVGDVNPIPEFFVAKAYVHGHNSNIQLSSDFRWKFSRTVGYHAYFSHRSSEPGDFHVRIFGDLPGRSKVLDIPVVFCQVAVLRITLTK